MNACWTGYLPDRLTKDVGRSLGKPADCFAERYSA